MYIKTYYKKSSFKEPSSTFDVDLESNRARVAVRGVVGRTLSSAKNSQDRPDEQHEYNNSAQRQYTTGGGTGSKWRQRGLAADETLDSNLGSGGVKMGMCRVGV